MNPLVGLSAEKNCLAIMANELTRNGRRSGLTFAPEGGSERIRKVINKMVTEEDLINTVAAAYGAGWR